MITNEQLMGYAADLLEPEERVEVEAALRDDVALKVELDAIRQLMSDLHDALTIDLPAPSGDPVWDRIAAHIALRDAEESAAHASFSGPAIDAPAPRATTRPAAAARRYVGDHRRSGRNHTRARSNRRRQEPRAAAPERFVKVDAGANTCSSQAMIAAPRSTSNAPGPPRLDRMFGLYFERMLLTLTFVLSVAGLSVQGLAFWSTSHSPAPSPLIVVQAMVVTATPPATTPPSHTPMPSRPQDTTASEPSRTPWPTSTPSLAVGAAETPMPSRTPVVGETPTLTSTSLPVSIPFPGNTPMPTSTPMPSTTPTPTDTPEPTSTPTATPEPSATPCAANQSQPLDVMLVLDRSGSMSAELTDVKVAAKQLVEALDTGSNRFGLVTFDKVAEINYELGQNTDTLLKAVDTIQTGPGTNIADGINVARQELTSARHRAGSLATLLIVSDGGSTLGDAPAAAAAARAENIHVIAIAVGHNADTQLLQSLASPGDLFPMSALEDLPAIERAISADTRDCARAGIPVPTSTPAVTATLAPPTSTPMPTPTATSTPMPTPTSTPASIGIRSVANLQTGVVLMTPEPTSTPAPAPSATAALISTPTATATPVPPTSTPAPSSTAPPTSTSPPTRIP